MENRKRRRRVFYDLRFEGEKFSTSGLFREFVDSNPAKESFETRALLGLVRNLIKITPPVVITPPEAYISLSGGGGASPKFDIRVYIKDLNMEYKEEEFYKELERLVIRDAKVLLSIPGVYEPLAEEYTNEILKILEERHGR